MSWVDPLRNYTWLSSRTEYILYFKFFKNYLFKENVYDFFEELSIFYGLDFSSIFYDLTFLGWVMILFKVSF